MRYELYNRFKTDIENGLLDKVLLDNYNLNFERNRYFKVNTDGSAVELTVDSDKDFENWIKERDMFAEYITYNKKIGHDNIMSNNFITLIFKIGKLKYNKDGKVVEMTKENIKEQFFDIFRNTNDNIDKIMNPKEEYDKKGKLKKQKAIKIQDKIISSNGLMDIDLLNTAERYLLKQFQNIKDYYNEDFFKDKSEKDLKQINEIKIKLFFDTPLDIYNKEVNRYLCSKIYTKNDYCKEENGLIYGIPNINISFNDKKIFLENLSMNCKNGFYVDINTAINLYKIDLILSKIKEKTLYIDNHLSLNNIYNISQENRQALSNTKMNTSSSKEGYFIEDYNIRIPFDNENSKFKIYNIMSIEQEKGVIEPNKNIPYFELYKEFQKFIDFDERKMKTYKFEILEDFCMNNNEDVIKQYYNKLIHLVILDLYRNNTKDKSGNKKIEYIDYNIKRILNIKYSFDIYFDKGGDTMDIEKLKQTVYNKVVDYKSLETDEEFFFLYGQFYKYLIKQSKADKPMMELLNLPSRLNSESALKREIKRTFERYAHAIHLNNKRVSNAINLILSYELKTKSLISYNDALYFGLHYDNLFYTKKEIEGVDNNEE